MPTCAEFKAVFGTEPEWRQEDADHWRAWLRSDHGQRQMALANFLEQAGNRQAALRTDGNHANSAGFARGWSEATRYFFTILAADVRPEQDEATEPGDEATRLRERLAS